MYYYNLSSTSLLYFLQRLHLFKVHGRRKYVVYKTVLGWRQPKFYFNAVINSQHATDQRFEFRTQNPNNCRHLSSFVGVILFVTKLSLLLSSLRSTRIVLALWQLVELQPREDKDNFLVFGPLFDALLQVSRFAG